MRNLSVAAALALSLGACGGPGGVPAPAPIEEVATRAALNDPAEFWNSATIYFLLTDRFANGNPANDTLLGRRKDGAVLRNFEGGDLAGVTRKIEEGYFTRLGVDAIWMTPFVEQIHGPVNEGTGNTYGFHGYWTRDWTAVDPALGTMQDLRRLVDAAHRHGIRVIMDAVLNHPGPVTPRDPAWPESWVRNEPQCTYRDYVTTVTCTLVRTLPDIRTDSDAPVELPPALVEKWRREGRLEQEQAELDAFFQRTGAPRAPRFYIIKWLTDWVRELGIDGYRFDTAKHVEESVSAELEKEAAAALEDFRRSHGRPGRLPFWMMGEVYGYGAGGGREYDFGDRKVDFFDFGYDALINFGFKEDAKQSYDVLFRRYEELLAGPLDGVAIVNYLSSHDDGSPFDPDRASAADAGTRLLLSPGAAQIYYGDELARPLKVSGARGDANLRSFMNWSDTTGSALLEHWRKLGQFRQAHPAVGAGRHLVLQADPYVFARTLSSGAVNDRVVIALGLEGETKSIPTGDIFPDGTVLRDSYSGTSTTVRNGRVEIRSPFSVVLLGR